MAKSAGRTNKTRPLPQTSRVDDFVLTISDSDEDVPDFEESSSEDEESKPEAKPEPVKTKKSKKAAAKAAKAQATQQDEPAEVLNPDFIFSLEDVGGVSTNFEGWDFAGDKKQDDQKSFKDVNLDDIIKRKGGLAGQFDQDESDKEKDNDSDDDELALDGFGMGAPEQPEEGNEEEDGEGEEEEEEGEDESGEEEAAEEEMLVEEDGSDAEKAGEDEDSEEAISKFYAPQEDAEKTNDAVHKDFQSLQLSRPVLKGLSALGYTKPSPIQSASIPIALLGKDIVAGAVTGSGKTAAYMIPIIERLLYKPSKIASTRVIILAPTRELAIQVADVGRRIGQYVNGLTFGLAVGGLNLRQQEQELKKRPDIVIATPGRFIDHIRNSPSFNVDSVEVLVFDEADRMLEEGFQKEMTEILSLLPTKRQTMLFSATMNSKIAQLIQLSLKRPVRIMIGAPKAAASGLVQEFVRIRKREASKPALLYNILSKMDRQQSRIIVFVSRKETAHRLRIVLGLLGLKVSELHGSLTQEQRLKSVTEFKKLVVPILICTDLAARGLDIPKIEAVVNFDMPKTHEIYLHRVGRTARAGREGVSISFVGESSQDRSIVKEAIKQIESDKSGKAVGRNVDWAEVDKVAKVVEEKSPIITEVLEEEKQEKEMLRAEAELKKGENLLQYQKEIQSRPKRTWFQSEKDKKADSAEAKQKVKNSKMRKAEEAREEFGRSYKKTKSDRAQNQTRSRPAAKNKRKGRK